jgi:hypothetical protein
MTLAATLGSLVFLLAAVGGSEVAEVAAPSAPTRSQFSTAILGARDYARTLDDVFGGVWITDEGAVFAFTYRATAAQVADVLAHLESWVPYATTRVESSEAELNAVADRVLEDVKAGQRPYLRSVAVDIHDNAVVIGIVPAEYCARQAELKQRYGEVGLVFRATEGDAGAEGDPGTPGTSPSPMASGQPQGPDTPICVIPSRPVTSPAPAPSDSISPSPVVPTAPTAEWGPMAITEARDADMADTGVEGGRLAIGKRCVTIRDANGADRARTTLVFREGQVRWDAERERIRFHNEVGGWVWLEDGDRLGSMGGWDPWTDTGPGPGIPAWVVQPNPACPADRVQIHEVSKP